MSQRVKTEIRDYIVLAVTHNPGQKWTLFLKLLLQIPAVWKYIVCLFSRDIEYMCSYKHRNTSFWSPKNAHNFVDFNAEVFKVNDDVSLDRGRYIL